MDAETISNKAAELDAAVATYNSELSNLSVWFTYLQDCKNHRDDPVTYPDEPEWPTEELPAELASMSISTEISGSVTDMNTRLTTLKGAVETAIADAPSVYSILPFLYVLSETAPTLPGGVPNTSTASPSQQHRCSHRN